MSSTTAGLKELHQLWLQFAEREKKLTAGPRRIQARQKLADAKITEIEAQKAKIIEMQKSADEVNLQVRTCEGRIAEYKTKLNQATSNKEFDIIKGQIESENEKTAHLEDKYLELLEAVDAVRRQQAELEKELEAANEDVKAAEDQLAAEEPTLKKETELLRAEIKEAEKCIPASMMDDYRRLVNVHGANSISVVETGACTTCFEELSPQLKVEIRMGKVIRCRSCGRLLYSEGDPG